MITSIFAITWISPSATKNSFKNVLPSLNISGTNPCYKFSEKINCLNVGACLSFKATLRTYSAATNTFNSTIVQSVVGASTCQAHDSTAEV